MFINSILFVVPRLDAIGGVSFYFKILKKHNPYLEYFIYDIKPHRKIYSKIISHSQNIIKYTKLLISKKIKYVQVNPSLLATSIIRDGIYLFLANILGIKVITYFFG